MPDTSLLRFVSGVNYATPGPVEDDPDYNDDDQLQRGGAPGTGSNTGTSIAEYVFVCGRRSFP